MSTLAIKVLQPVPGAVFKLRATCPVESAPIQLRAVLFDGEREVTSEAQFRWVLSWQGTYRPYFRLIAKAAAASAQLETGGELLRVFATYKGQDYHGSVPISVAGENPTREQVAAKIGPDDRLAAICWLESERTWRQFNAKGKPAQDVLPSGVSSSRGIARVQEYTWARTTEIEHNDYPRCAWQWDYCIDTASEILCYLEKQAPRRIRRLDFNTFQNHIIKAYTLGESCFKTKEDPGKFAYVRRVRGFMSNKPWEGKR